MKTIFLSKTELSLLKRICSDNQLNLLSITIQNGKSHLNGTNEQFEIIVDVITDELSKNGFDSNSEPTNYGREIEGLIDAFSSIYD